MHIPLKVPESKRARVISLDRYNYIRTQRQNCCIYFCLIQFTQAQSEKEFKEERKKLSEEVKKAKAELQQKTAIISGLNVSR